MAAPTYDIIDTFLNQFNASIDSGFGLIQGDVGHTFSLLIVIAVTSTAIFWALDENQTIAASLFRKVLLVGFFAYLINDWSGLSQTVINGFGQFGLKAGGSTLSAAQFFNSPSTTVRLGMDLAAQILEQIKTLSGPVAFFENIAIIIVLALAAIGIILSFIVLAVQIFILLIEFRLVTLAAFVLIPFGILRQSSFLTERAIGYVISAGLKLMTIALIVSIGTSIFSTMTLPPEPAIEPALSVLVAAIVQLGLALTVPAVAGALVSGGPQLGAGAVVAGAAGIAAGAGGAYLAGRAALGAPGAVANRAAAAQAAAGAATGQASGAGLMQRAVAASDTYSSEMQSGSAATNAWRPGGARYVAANADSGGSGAPSSAPSPATTVARARARAAGMTPVGGAQAAGAAAARQRGPGLHADLKDDDDA